MSMEISYLGGKKVQAKWKQFLIVTDQSRQSGGEESAPSPFDLFLASIGNCAGFYVLEFCQERKIPTEEIKLEVQFNRNSNTRLIDMVQIDINLPSTFPEKYITAVKRSADQCTVKKHLVNPPQFEIQSKINKN